MRHVGVGHHRVRVGYDVEFSHDAASPTPRRTREGQMLRSIGQTLPGPVSLEKQKQLSSPFRPHAIVPRRIRGSFVGLVILASLALLYRLHTYFASPSDDILDFLRDLPRPEGGSNPPRFYEWHDREKRLPQHNPDLPYPQGRDGRYIRFANQLDGAWRFGGASFCTVAPSLSRDSQFCR
jgi:hypothetical protein